MPGNLLKAPRKSLKMNEVSWVDFELTTYDVTVSYVSYPATETPLHPIEWHTYMIDT